MSEIVTFTSYEHRKNSLTQACKSIPISDVNQIEGAQSRGNLRPCRHIISCHWTPSWRRVKIELASGMTFGMYKTWPDKSFVRFASMLNELIDHMDEKLIIHFDVPMVHK